VGTAAADVEVSGLGACLELTQEATLAEASVSREQHDDRIPQRGGMDTPFKGGEVCVPPDECSGGRGRPLS
jgi:hypothetical protein